MFIDRKSQSAWKWARLRKPWKIVVIKHGIIYNHNIYIYIPLFIYIIYIYNIISIIVLYGTIIHYRFYQRFYRLICFRHPEGCFRQAGDRLLQDLNPPLSSGGGNHRNAWPLDCRREAANMDLGGVNQQNGSSLGFQIWWFLITVIFVQEYPASPGKQMRSDEPPAMQIPKKIVVSPGHHRPRSQRQKIPQMQLKWPGPGMRRSQFFFLGGGWGKHLQIGIFCIFYWE